MRVLKQLCNQLSFLLILINYGLWIANCVTRFAYWPPELELGSFASPNKLGAFAIQTCPPPTPYLGSKCII
eukprot:jgi/Botrbrau1/19970/Bobra.0059s0085.1